MTRFAVFYYLQGPYGLVKDRFEVFLCQAEDAQHAAEQFFDSTPHGTIQFVMMEV